MWTDDGRAFGTRGVTVTVREERGALVIGLAGAIDVPLLSSLAVSVAETVTGPVVVDLSGITVAGHEATHLHEALATGGVHHHRLALVSPQLARPATGLATGGALPAFATVDEAIADRLVARSARRGASPLQLEPDRFSAAPPVVAVPVDTVPVGPSTP